MPRGPIACEHKIEFKLLGPLEVSDERGPLSLGPPQQRALLALLLLNANEVMSRDRLIDELWGERPPATAAKLVQVYVSQLRKALEPDRSGSDSDVLITQAPGYRLRVGPGELDLSRFESLLEQGRKALSAGAVGDAAERYREALALWRGPPLADFAFEPFAESEIGRLEELHLTALENRIEADLAEGRTDLVGELEALIARYPLRERLRGQLMLALYRSGRQAEALEAYRLTRRALVEELGIEPGRQLQELEQAILEQDARLELAVEPAPMASEEGRGAFVGREAELNGLLAGLEDAIAGRGNLSLISGEPGIGKSRLVEELMRNARARRARVLVGRCWEGGGAPAYWPWVQVLRGYLRECDPERLREQLGSGAADVAQIVPELGDLLPGLPPPEAAKSEAARFRLFDSTASFLREASMAQPIVLALDDVHAADEPSLLLLRFVAGVLADSRICLVGTFRDVDPTVRDPLRSTLVELGREPVTRRRPLSGLSRSDVGRFIELIAGAEPSPQAIIAVHQETEGNPLFLGEIVRLLVGENRLEQFDESAAASVGLPEGVRDVIGRRLGRLSDECRRVLVLASVMGREFAMDALGRVSELSEGELLGALDEAFEERVVAGVPGAPGRLRFSHALIRDTLYESLPGGRRLRLHRQVGEALEVLYARDPTPHLAELAHHFVAAAPAGSAERAIEYARRAGDRATALLAYEDAVELYRMALTLVDDDVSNCDLLLALGDAQARAGESSEARRTFLEAAGFARKAALPDRLALAALGYGGRFVWARAAAADEHIVPLLESALTAMGDADSRLRVMLLSRLAGALRDEPSRESPASLSQEAEMMARRIGDPETLAYALDGRYSAIWWPENPEERLLIATELVQLAEEIGDKERAFQGHDYRNCALLELGDIAAIDAELDVMAIIAEELRQPAQLWIVFHTRAMRALLDGRFDDAEQLIGEAFGFGQRAQRWDAVLSHNLQMYGLRRGQGRLGEVEANLRRAVDEYPTRSLIRCALACINGELGRGAEARNTFEDLAANGFGDLPKNNDWRLEMSFLAEACASLGDAGRAATLYEFLLPEAGRLATYSPDFCIGPVSHYLGRLASTMSRWEDAERHFEEALATNGQIGARPWLAETQEHYARMLSARGEPGESERALELIRRALDGYRRLGMDAFAAEATRLERALSAAAP